MATWTAGQGEEFDFRRTQGAAQPFTATGNLVTWRAFSRLLQEDPAKPPLRTLPTMHLASDEQAERYLVAIPQPLNAAK